jgi:methyl-accepting chemotaxis protein
MFVAPAERDSSGYREFWAKLNRGEFQSAEYKRFGKGGKEVWILASYNPILDDSGKPFKVVKFASDVSEQKLKAADFAGQVEAIGKSQAVIEFSMDGIVLDANENFLKTLGYSLAEIKGKHHSMFVQPEEHRSDAYRVFWANLNRGEFQSAEYKRIGKGGKEVWIQASCNPIRDLNGNPYKVVKYATDTVGKANGSRECAPDDKLRVPTIPYRVYLDLTNGGHGAKRAFCPPYQRRLNRPDFNHVGHEMLQQILDAVLQRRGG